MRSATSSLPIWFVALATACGPQLAALFPSLRSELHAERRPVFVVEFDRPTAVAERTAISASGVLVEPWEVRSNPISQILAKLEQAADGATPWFVAVATRDSSAHEVIAPLASPALLRLSSDLAHVRLLI